MRLIPLDMTGWQYANIQAVDVWACHDFLKEGIIIGDCRHDQTLAHLLKHFALWSLDDLGKREHILFSSHRVVPGGAEQYRRMQIRTAIPLNFSWAIMFVHRTIDRTSCLEADIDGSIHHLCHPRICKAAKNSLRIFRTPGEDFCDLGSDGICNLAAILWYNHSGCINARTAAVC